MPPLSIAYVSLTSPNIPIPGRSPVHSCAAVVKSIFGTCRHFSKLAGGRFRSAHPPGVLSPVARLLLHIPVQLTVCLTLRFKNSPYKDHCAHKNQARKHAYRAGQKVEPCCRAAKKNSTDEQSNS